ncbi:DUF58 domain-containing protein [Arthrobacter glacialis]|uniref:DUF58 domain-containing protein n=1 Tax=Arthrobacter glacialis TaxID=1664 RepID=A0A2S3ZXL1_ARTGL|nr:DUF58 domain-containing protein [Arthrobacter glacialis]POH58842.1 DUF58 domain-containing protein [Arthrobacter glacialis]POH73637.1 DUF58 domain-containing protein [Arthrobacter glacialis]
MGTLLTAVKSKMYIFAHRRARGMLDGEYAAIFRGRSLDFDDLRDYVPGDEVRDIDWKATARVGTPLIKRYVATRRQQLLFVADTGRNMAAAALGGEIKKDIAVMAMGVLGSLAIRHGDSVALVHGDGASSLALPAKGTESHLEQVLQRMDAATLGNGPSDLCARLEYVAAHYKQRMLLVVIADDVNADDRLATVLRRLRAQHEILWVQVADAELAGPAAAHSAAMDVAGMETLLLLLAQDPELAASYLDATAARSRALAELLKSNGIAATSIGSTTLVLTKVFALLERHRRAH